LSLRLRSRWWFIRHAIRSALAIGLLLAIRARLPFTPISQALHRPSTVWSWGVVPVPVAPTASVFVAVRRSDAFLKLSISDLARSSMDAGDDAGHSEESWEKLHVGLVEW